MPNKQLQNGLSQRHTFIKGSLKLVAEGAEKMRCSLRVIMAILLYPLCVG